MTGNFLELTVIKLRNLFGRVENLSLTSLRYNGYALIVVLLFDGNSD